MAAASGDAGDVRVKELVAVLGDVIAAQAVE